MTIINKELENIDPWADDLTDAQEKAIIEEAKNNIEYFAGLFKKPNEK